MTIFASVEGVILLCCVASEREKVGWVGCVEVLWCEKERGVRREGVVGRWWCV